VCSTDHHIPHASRLEGNTPELVDRLEQLGADATSVTFVLATDCCAEAARSQY
jgi:hypothetical protein